MPSLPPAGLTPASAFTLVVQTEQVAPPAILADDINPKTHDYNAIDSGIGIADGFVITLLSIQRGSGAAVREFGQRWREVTHADGESPAVVRSMTEEALRPARDAGVVQLQSAAAEIDATDPSQVNHEIEYTDLLAPPNDLGERDRNLTFTEGRRR